MRKVRSDDNDLVTGWFGIPGANGKWSTKVHVVDRNSGKSICGARLSARQEFMQCAVGICWSYIECPKCKQLSSEIIARMKKSAEVLSKVRRSA